MVPTVAFPPATPFTFQTTALFAVFPPTRTLNCCVAPVLTRAKLGDTFTQTRGALF